MKKYTIAVRTVGEEEMLDGAGMALMYGVSEEEIKAISPGPLPIEWIKAGRRRAREGMAATGSRQWIDVLGYWARKDHNAELLVVEQ